MIINALNSGADSYMTDFEDSNAPSWTNQIDGQINLKDAVRRTISLEQNGKSYRLNDKVATLIVRPRGWHLDEKHVTVDGQRVSGGIFDFALFLFHNAKELLARGSAVLLPAEDGKPSRGAPVERHLRRRAGRRRRAARHDPRDGADRDDPRRVRDGRNPVRTARTQLGLNAGRWDYIFSAIKKFKNDRDFCLAERSKITMTVPFMRAYALLLLKTCHKRNAPAIGGMSALIPIKNDPEANDKAMGGVRSDKQRDATDGYDGGWVAHPGLVPIAMEEFVKVLGDKPNQIAKQRDDVQVEGKNLLDFQPEAPITEAGLRNNINVGIHYLGAWLDGNGCVPIHNLMEDAATAEISRSQVWQWIRSPKGVLDDGRKVTAELVRELSKAELDNVKRSVGGNTQPYERAAAIFEQMSTSEGFTEFLTLPLYEEI